MMLFTRSKRRFTQLQLLRRKVRESRVALYGQSGVVSEIEASKCVER